MVFNPKLNLQCGIFAQGEAGAIDEDQRDWRAAG
jgi:hypothetical protein